MSLALRLISFTASEIGTFETCESQFYHQQQRYTHGLLATDRIAAEVGSACHDALMKFQRELEPARLSGHLPTAEQAISRLQRLVQQEVRRRRLEPNQPAVCARLDKLLPGIERVAALVLNELPRWAVDPVRNQVLLWEEARLDHGPRVEAVELAPGVLVRTRPDVLGIVDDAGRFRAAVLEFKTRGQVVDPAFDLGVLIRAWWTLQEVRRPRCQWFLAGRNLPVATDAIEVCVVNLGHAATPDFEIRAALDAETIAQRVAELIDTVTEMDGVRRAELVAAVTASPGGLCRDWCCFLGKCRAGQDHVLKYDGPEVLAQRLSGA